MGIRSWLGKLSLSPKALAKYQWTASFLKLFNGYSPFPLHVDLVLTMRCNLSCDFCVCLQEENAGIVASCRAPELSITEWKDVVRSIKKGFFFRPNLNLLGGEPSVYRGYLDLAAFIKQEGFRCSYTTNGTFLARDAEKIVSVGVDVIAVSIDGRQEVHDSIRGAGVFERAAEGIRAIEKLKRRRGTDTPHIFLASTISGDSYGCLSDLVDVADELGIDYVDFLHLQFSDAEIDSHHIDVDGLMAAMARAKGRAAEMNVSVSFYPHLKAAQIPVYYSQPSNRLGKGCISPWIRMVILPNGKVIPCGDYVVGDFRAEGSTARSIWNSNAFREFRNQLAESRLFASCQRCCRKQY